MKEPEKTEKSFEYEFELEKHIHEQYAINSNANVSSFISFLIALFTLFSIYGYCYWLFVNGIEVYQNKGISLDDFCILSLFVIVVLAFLFLMSQQLGYAQRRDQIIIDRIRKENYQKERNIKIYSRVFSSKGKGYLSFIQGYFNLFCLLFFISFTLVCFITFWSIGKKYSITCSTDNNNLPFTLYFFGSLIIFLFCFVKRYCLYKKYLRMQKPRRLKGVKLNLCFFSIIIAKKKNEVSYRKLIRKGKYVLLIQK